MHVGVCLFDSRKFVDTYMFVCISPCNVYAYPYVRVFAGNPTGSRKQLPSGCVDISMPDLVHMYSKQSNSHDLHTKGSDEQHIFISSPTR